MHPRGPIAGNLADDTLAPNNTGWTPIAACTPAALICRQRLRHDAMPDDPAPVRTAVASCAAAARPGQRLPPLRRCATTVIQPWTNVGTCTAVGRECRQRLRRSLCQTVNSVAGGGLELRPAGRTAGPGRDLQQHPDRADRVWPSCTPAAGNAGNGCADHHLRHQQHRSDACRPCTLRGRTRATRWTTITCSSSVVGLTARRELHAGRCRAGQQLHRDDLQYCHHRARGSGDPAADRAHRRQQAARRPRARPPDGPFTPMASCCARRRPDRWQFLDGTTCNTINTGPTLVASQSPIAPTAGQQLHDDQRVHRCNTGPTPVSSCTLSPAVRVRNSLYRRDLQHDHES